jgi:hypothetical protein
MFRQRPQSASMPSVRSFSSCWWLAARLAVNRVRAGGQPQFQVETGASWAVVVFDITVFLSKRAQRPDAVGGSGRGWFWQRPEVQPQFQVETGASWAVVVFDITVFLSKRAQRSDAVGGSGGGWFWQRPEVQPQFQVETGPRVVVVFVIADSFQKDGRCGPTLPGGFGLLVLLGAEDSAPVPGRDRAHLGDVRLRRRPLLGGVLREHRLDGLDERLHRELPFEGAHTRPEVWVLAPRPAPAGTREDSHWGKLVSRQQTVARLRGPLAGETGMPLAYK